LAVDDELGDGACGVGDDEVGLPGVFFDVDLFVGCVSGEEALGLATVAAARRLR